MGVLVEPKDPPGPTCVHAVPKGELSTPRLHLGDNVAQFMLAFGKQRFHTAVETVQTALFSDLGLFAEPAAVHSSPRCVAFSLCPIQQHFVSLRGC